MENFFFYLTPDPSPIGEGSASAGLFGGLSSEAFRLGSSIMPSEIAPFPASGKGRGWGIGGEKTKKIVVSILPK